MAALAAFGWAGGKVNARLLKITGMSQRSIREKKRVKRGEQGKLKKVTEYEKWLEKN